MNYKIFKVEIEEELADGILTPSDKIQVLRKDGVITDWYYSDELMKSDLTPEYDDTEREIDVKQKIQELYEQDKPYLENISVSAFLSELKQSELILIAEYAKIHGRKPNSVRRKCLRNGFKTAKKIGRDWFIDKNEPYSDNRNK